MYLPLVCATYVCLVGFDGLCYKIKHKHQRFFTHFLHTDAKKRRCYRVSA